MPEEIEVTGIPSTCPHCGVFTGQSYWVHRALVHPELNPKPPAPETKPKKKKAKR